MASKKLTTSWLNQNQEKFCRYYLSDEINWNGTRAYMKAYPDASEETARVEATTNLAKPNIKAYMQSLMNINGFNDEFMDNQLLNLAKQDVDKPLKLRAVDSYNKLLGRIEDKSRNVNSNFNNDSEDLDNGEYKALLDSNWLI